MVNNYVEIQFAEYMIAQRLYMQPHITINSACRSMEVTPQELAEYLSYELNTSFEKVVNIYRIEEAKDIWCISSEISIGEIAHMVGYGNSLMFLYHFTREEKCLPHVWKRRMLVTV